jgi:hypothetical protein
MKDTTKHSLNVHLEAREIRGEIEPTDNVQGNTREVEYVLKAKELCANIYGMTFPMRYATNMKNMKGFAVYKTKKIPTKANKRPSSLHQKYLAVMSVVSAILMIETFVTDIQSLVRCYHQRPVRRPW